MSEELSLPSLDLIQPGAFKDAAACDRLRDQIASECEALLQRFEAEKEAALNSFEKQAQDQMDQIQNELEQEQAELQKKKLAEQEAIFKKQIQETETQSKSQLQKALADAAAEKAAAVQKALAEMRATSDSSNASEAMISQAVAAQLAVIKANTEREQEAFRAEVKEFSDKAMQAEIQRMKEQAEKDQEAFRVEIEQFASQQLAEEERKLRVELDRENDAALQKMEQEAQAQLDAEVEKLKAETEREQELFRKQVEEFASKTLEEEEVKLRAEFDREKLSMQASLQQAAVKSLEEEEKKLRAQIEQERSQLQSQASEGQSELLQRISVLQTEKQQIADEIQTLKSAQSQSAELNQQLQASVAELQASKDAQQNQLSELQAACDKLKIDAQAAAAEKESQLAAKDNAISQLKSEHAHQLELLQNQSSEGSAELVKSIQTQHANEVTALKETHQQELNKAQQIATEHSQALEEQLKQLKQQLELQSTEAAKSESDIKSTHAEQLQALQTQHSEALSKLQAELDGVSTKAAEQVAAAKTLASQLVQTVRTQNEGEMEKLRESLKLEHSAAIEAVRTQSQLDVNTAQSAVTAANEQIAKLHAELETAQQAMALKEQEFVQLRSEQTQQVELQQKSASETMSSLQAQHGQALQSLTDAHQQALKASTEELDKLRQELTSAHQQAIADLKTAHAAELQSAESKADETAIKLCEDLANDMNAKKQSELDELRQQLTAQFKTAQEKAAQLHEESIATLTTQHGNALAELKSEHARQLELLQGQNKDGSAELAKAIQSQHEKELAALKEAHQQDMSTSAQKLREELTLQLQSEHAVILKDRDVAHSEALNAEIAKAKTQLDELTQQLETVKQGSTQTASQITAMQAERDSALQKLSEAESQLNVLQINLEEQSSKVLSQESELQLAAEAAKALKAEMKLAAEQLVNLQSADQQAIHTAHTEAINALKAQHADLIAKLSLDHTVELQSKQSEATGACAKLEADLRAEFAQAAAAQESASQLLMNDAATLCDDLQEKLVRQKEQLVSLQAEHQLAISQLQLQVQNTQSNPAVNDALTAEIAQLQTQLSEARVQIVDLESKRSMELENLQSKSTVNDALTAEIAELQTQLSEARVQMDEFETKRSLELKQNSERELQMTIDINQARTECDAEQAQVLVLRDQLAALEGELRLTKEQLEELEQAPMHKAGPMMDMVPVHASALAESVVDPQVAELQKELSDRIAQISALELAAAQAQQPLNWTQEAFLEHRSIVTECVQVLEAEVVRAGGTLPAAAVTDAKPKMSNTRAPSIKPGTNVADDDDAPVAVDYLRISAIGHSTLHSTNGLLQEPLALCQSDNQLLIADRGASVIWRVDLLHNRCTALKCQAPPSTVCAMDDSICVGVNELSQRVLCAITDGTPAALVAGRANLAEPGADDAAFGNWYSNCTQIVDAAALDASFTDVSCTVSTRRLRGFEGQSLVMIAQLDGHCVRAFNPSTGRVIKLCGTGYPGLPKDGCSSDPASLAVDAQGRLHVGSLEGAILRLKSKGKLKTVAGKVGERGFEDGVGIQARLSSASSMCVDPFDTLYFTDQDNHAVRAISPEGMVYTIAVNADVAAAELPPHVLAVPGMHAPCGIWFDEKALAAGRPRLFVCAGGSNVIELSLSHATFPAVAPTAGAVFSPSWTGGLRVPIPGQTSQQSPEEFKRLLNRCKELAAESTRCARQAALVAPDVRMTEKMLVQVTESFEMRLAAQQRELSDTVIAFESRLASTNAASESSLAAAREEIATQRRAVSEQMEKQMQLLNENMELGQQNDELSERVADLEQGTQDLEFLRASHQQMLSLTDELTATKASLTQLQSEFEALQAKAELDSKTYASERESLLAEHAAKLSEMVEVQERVAAVQRSEAAENRKLRLELEAQQQLVARNEDIVREARASVTALQAQSKEAEKAITDFKLKEAELETVRAELQSVGDSSAAEIRSLTQQLASSRAEAQAELARQKAAAAGSGRSKETEAQAKQLAEAQSSLKELQSRYDELEQQHQLAVKATSETSESQTQAAVADLEAKHAAAIAALEAQHSAAVAELQAQNSRVSSSVDELQSKLKDVQTKLDDAEARMADELIRARERINVEVSQRIAQLEVEAAQAKATAESAAELVVAAQQDTANANAAAAASLVAQHAAEASCTALQLVIKQHERTKASSASELAAAKQAKQAIEAAAAADRTRADAASNETKALRDKIKSLQATIAEKESLVIQKDTEMEMKLNDATFAAVREAESKAAEAQKQLMEQLAGSQADSIGKIATLQASVQQLTDDVRERDERQRACDTKLAQCEHDLNRLRRGQESTNSVLKANEALIAGQNKYIAQLKRDAAELQKQLDAALKPAAESSAEPTADGQVESQTQPAAAPVEEEAAPRMDSRAVANLKLALDAAAAASQSASALSRQSSRVNVPSASTSSSTFTSNATDTPSRSMFLGRPSSTISIPMPNSAAAASPSSSLSSRFSMFMSRPAESATPSGARANSILKLNRPTLSTTTEASATPAASSPMGFSLRIRGNEAAADTVAAQASPAPTTPARRPIFLNIGRASPADSAK